MLDEARADNKENDAEYLKPSIRTSCKRLSSLHFAIAHFLQDTAACEIVHLHSDGVRSWVLCVSPLILCEDLFLLYEDLLIHYHDLFIHYIDLFIPYQDLFVHYERESKDLLKASVSYPIVQTTPVPMATQ